MKNGAYDYVNKPFNLEEFILKIDKAIEKIRITKELNSFKNLVTEKEPYFGIIGTSKRMMEVYDFIDKTSKINVNVLIQGQSGTGKELSCTSAYISAVTEKIILLLQSTAVQYRKIFLKVNCSDIQKVHLREQ